MQRKVVGKKYRHVVRYQNGARTATRWATSAVAAIQAQCDRYGWSWCLTECDGLTNGKQWAKAYVDRNGGGNYVELMTATREEG